MQNKYFIPEGFLFSGISCGIKKEGELDIALIFLPTGGIAEGVFTKNTVKAAPVILGKKLLKRNKIVKGVLVNSGIANACTGKHGIIAAQKLLESLKKLLNLSKEEIILPASTGVIGEPLPVDKIIKSFPELINALSPDNIENFAKAILTTDSFIKIVSKKVEEACILGIAKGAGMIAPNMATMLAFICTDAKFSLSWLKKNLKNWVENSFNSISVDEDMSTNDTVYFLSSLKKEIKDLNVFRQACEKVMKELAYLIVKDGEGATKVIKVLVKGAKTKKEAKVLARAVATSLLVRTAFYGGDPNWGRIFASLGKTTIKFDPEKVDLYLNGIPWVKNLKPVNQEEILIKEMRKKEVFLTIDLKQGRAQGEFWASDLTEEYIKINAHYRT